MEWGLEMMRDVSIWACYCSSEYGLLRTVVEVIGISAESETIKKSKRSCRICINWCVDICGGMLRCYVHAGIIMYMQVIVSLQDGNNHYSEQ